MLIFQVGVIFIIYFYSFSRVKLNVTKVATNLSNSKFQPATSDTDVIEFLSNVFLIKTMSHSQHVLINLYRNTAVIYSTDFLRYKINSGISFIDLFELSVCVCFEYLNCTVHAYIDHIIICKIIMVSKGFRKAPLLLKNSHTKNWRKFVKL